MNYGHHSATIQELKDIIEQNIREIQSTVLENIFQNFFTRIYCPHCGGHLADVLFHV